MLVPVMGVDGQVSSHEEIETVESLGSPTALIISFWILVRSAICMVLKLDFPSVSLMITGGSWVSLPHSFFLGGRRFAFSSRPISLTILVVGLPRAGLDSEVGCLVRALIVGTKWGAYK